LIWKNIYSSFTKIKKARSCITGTGFFIGFIFN